MSDRGILIPTVAVASQREQIAALHQRLAVLERIATDPTARIAADIDPLR